MKHSRTSLLFGTLLFLLLSGMKAMAQEPAALQVNIATTDDLRIQLTGRNDTGKKLYLTVLMQEDATFSRVAETEIYSEEISADIAGFNRVLNLSKLESGTYRISIKAGKQHFDRYVNIRSKPVTDDTRIIALQ